MNWRLNQASSLRVWQKSGQNESQDKTIWYEDRDEST